MVSQLRVTLQHIAADAAAGCACSLRKGSDADYAAVQSSQLQKAAGLNPESDPATHSCRRCSKTCLHLEERPESMTSQE